MAGRGPAPTSKETRRRTNVPTRGDWVDIFPPSKPTLPTLASIERGSWHPRTRRQWEAWRKDAASSMFGPADVAAAVELIYLVEEFVTEGPASLAAEIRLRMDGLGLTPKGKQERRWRVADELEATGASSASKADDEVARRRKDREDRLAAGAGK